MSRTPSVLQNDVYEARELARGTFPCRGGYIDDKDAQERHSMVAFIRKMQLKNQTETLSHRSPKDYNKASKCCWGCRNDVTMTHVELLGTLNAKATQGKQFASLLRSTMQLLHERLRNSPHRNQSLNYSQKTNLIIFTKGHTYVLVCMNSYLLTVPNYNHPPKVGE